jgi:hypothetical protein
MGRFGSVLLTGFLAGPSAAAPMGIALHLSPLAAVLAVALGAFASFVVALFAMEWLRTTWPRRRARWARMMRWLPWPRRWRLLSRRLERRSSPEHAAKRAARSQRARAVLLKFGPVGFGLVGPALFGTWVSAVLGSALGLARWRLLGWLVVGATVWSALLVVLSQTMLGWLFASA